MRDEERLFKVGRTWHTWVYIAGKRIKRTTGKRTKSAARLVARQLEEASADPARAAQEATTVEDALDAVLTLRREQAKAGERSPETAEFFRKKSGHLLRLLGRETTLAALRTSAVLDEYVSSRRREEVRDHTIYKELVVMRAALKLAKRRGRWTGAIEAVMPALAPRYQPRRTFLTPESLAKLMRELEADDAARAAFCVATGAELRATVLARREDVGSALVLLRGTKRASRAREVPIVTPWQRDALRGVLALATGKGLLFRKTGDEFRWAVKYAARRAGLEHVTPNDLRRTFATWLRAAGAHLATIAPTMGHADTRMLERVYAALTPAMLAERLKAEMGLDTVGTDQSAMPSTSGIPGTAPPSEKVPRGGIEPPTRGFSVPGRTWELHREFRALSAAQRSHLDRVGTVRRLSALRR